MDHDDHDRSPHQPAQGRGRDADLVAGQRQPVLLRDDLRHASGDGQRQRISEQEQDRGQWVQDISVPGRSPGRVARSIGQYVGDDPVDLLGDDPSDVGMHQLERRQELIGLGPGSQLEHLEFVGIDGFTEPCSRGTTGAQMASNRLAAEPFLPPFPDVVE